MTGVFSIYIFCNFHFIILLTGGQPGYLDCSQAFLFSIINTHGLKPIILPLKTALSDTAIHCDSEHGPTFGRGPEHDLYISGNANRNENSHSNLHSYSCPPRMGSFFTGAQHFTVLNYEVFGLGDCQVDNLR